MASGIFAVLDDIASLMDDVAVTSKMATSKTVGILGDDLAVNAEKATGFLSSRELPVLWAITKGSLLNKVILIPVAILLQIFLPAAINIMLIMGGFYLAYEGAEKIIEFLFHRSKSGHEVIEESEESQGDAEKNKIQSAIKTDFILSIEIVIIALGSVLDKSLTIQIITVSVVALVATDGVYGVVALIVRMDDAGFKLIKGANDKGPIAKLGHLLVGALPLLIKALGVIGTIALLFVSGGIFIHNVTFLHHFLPEVPFLIKELGISLVAGLLAVAMMTLFKKLFSKSKG